MLLLLLTVTERYQRLLQTPQIPQLSSVFRSDSALHETTLIMLLGILAWYLHFSSFLELD